MTKTNFFVLNKSLYSAASKAIQNYVLLSETHIQHKLTPIKRFICIARKKTITSTLNKPLLKDALALPQAKE